jgi:hypothetical protein
MEYRSLNLVTVLVVILSLSFAIGLALIRTSH